MGRILFLVFLAVPVLEIGLFIIMGQAIGILPTMAGVVVTAVIGSYVIRKQGLSLISEIQSLLGRGALPARQIADGVMLAIAGALLLTPGYLTDFFGFLLLVPIVRGQVYNILKSRITVKSSFSSSSQSNPAYGKVEENIVDLDDKDWR